MKIELQHVSKRYNYDWIFRDLNRVFEKGKIYAVTGPNGCGKSTLLKILSGQLSPSEGEIFYSNENGSVSTGDIFRYVSFSAPYIDLIEDFTWEELISFHSRFKPFRAGIRAEDLLEKTGLVRQSKKQIKYYSSGMKQRVKIALSVFSDSDILLLDEPTTNLDSKGAAWYNELLNEYGRKCVTIIASNLEREFSFCDENISLSTLL